MMSTATVDAATLQTLLAAADPPRLLDVRTPAEFESQHIAGAYNVPLDLLREHRDEIIDHLDRQVVLICRSGQRAAHADQTLRQAGLTNVSILAGGITGWEARGFALNRGTPRWDLERQVRLVAGLIIAVSALLSVFVSGVEWIAFTMGVGLAVAALTNTCAMGMLLARLPFNGAGAKCDAATITSQLLRAANTPR
ncbi:rhodanese-like domain-containing protein [Mycobacterium sp. NPDC051804]|uniref:rhodanese-like domain-containing protein n=1 Tax=Mycobacterium sp. NPDC051804 TaxID=3364295 RepID=UPI0037A118BB